jgi:hypothetical protein
MNQSLARAALTRAQAAGTLLVLAIALALGALTDLGQAWLPQSSASLANSGASWAAVAFVLALFAAGTGRAALWGLLGLAGLVGGYYLAAISRHVPESPGSIRFWMLAAVIIGPLLGVAASWVRRGSPVTAALGAGAAAGLLGGESVYGLTTIAGSTSSLYWTIQLALAVALLAALDAWRVQEGAAIVLSVVTAATVGALTALVYLKGLARKAPARDLTHRHSGHPPVPVASRGYSLPGLEGTSVGAHPDLPVGGHEEGTMAIWNMTGFASGRAATSPRAPIITNPGAAGGCRHDVQIRQFGATTCVR